jgi:hypothetical protein
MSEALPMPAAPTPQQLAPLPHRSSKLSAPSPDLASFRAEIDRLSARLSARASITWFARCFVLGCVGGIAFGVSARLLADSARLPLFLWPIAALSLACLSASLYSYVRARRVLRCERAEFRRLCELRARIGMS